MKKRSHQANRKWARAFNPTNQYQENMRTYKISTMGRSLWKHDPLLKTKAIHKLKFRRPHQEEVIMSNQTKEQVLPTKEQAEMTKEIQGGGGIITELITNSQSDIIAVTLHNPAGVWNY